PWSTPPDTNCCRSCSGESCARAVGIGPASNIKTSKWNNRADISISLFLNRWYHRQQEVRGISFGVQDGLPGDAPRFAMGELCISDPHVWRPGIRIPLSTSSLATNDVASP